MKTQPGRRVSWLCYLGFILMLVCLLSASCRTAGPKFQQGKGIVRAVRGPTECSYGGGWHSLKVDSVIKAGCSLRTHNNSQVLIYLEANDSVLRLAANSILRLDDLAYTKTNRTNTRRIIVTKLSLLRGTMQVVVSKALPGSVYEISTPNTVLHVRQRANFALCDCGALLVTAGQVTVVQDNKVHCVNSNEFLDPADEIVGKMSPRVDKPVKADSRCPLLNSLDAFMSLVVFGGWTTHHYIQTENVPPPR